MVIRSYTDDSGNRITETARTDAKLRATGTPDNPPEVELDLPDPKPLPLTEPDGAAVPAPKVEEKADPAPKVEEKADPAPEVEEKADPAPKVEEKANPAPEVDEKADPAPEVDEKADPAPKVEEKADPVTKPKSEPKKDDQPILGSKSNGGKSDPVETPEPIVLGGKKGPEDLTITDRAVERKIGQKVGDLTTGDFEDDITITSGGPRTVNTGDGTDVVETLGGTGNTIKLGKGDDIAIVNGGNNDIDGGEGYDLVHLNRTRDEFDIDVNRGADGAFRLIFTDKNDGSTTKLLDVSEIEFSDGEVVDADALFDEVLFLDNLPE